MLTVTLKVRVDLVLALAVTEGCLRARTPALTHARTPALLRPMQTALRDGVGIPYAAPLNRSY